MHAYVQAALLAAANGRLRPTLLTLIQKFVFSGNDASYRAGM